MNRCILRLSGTDARPFLQGLITNDVLKVDQGPIYAALLTPQGKYLADFFVTADADDLLIDVAAEQGDMLGQRLSMYKLRADVMIAQTDLYLHRGLGEVPADGYADPRHPAMGWRAYRASIQTDDVINWTALRVEHIIPQAGVELTPDSFILETGFDRLNGVDFRKGCYVGQEVTARMRHKTELRKGIVRVEIEGEAKPGTAIMAGEKPAGTLHSVSDNRALAYLRFARANDPMQAGDATIRWVQHG